MGKKGDKTGDFNVSDDALEVIAGLAASRISGVAGLRGGVVETITDWLGKRTPTKGIKVSVKEKKVVADIHLLVEYGKFVPEVAEKVQLAVKNELESMTGLTAQAINIFVDGIHFPHARPQKSHKVLSKKKGKKKSSS